MMKLLYPRYAHYLKPTAGKTYHLATDVPPPELVGFWSDVNYACVSKGHEAERITDADAARYTGFGYPAGAFTIVKWLNVRLAS